MSMYTAMMLIFLFPEWGHKHKKLKLHTSLTASTSSTVAEEIVVLVRRLHPLRAWNTLLNRYIGENLQWIPRLIATMPGNHLTMTTPHKKEEEAVRNKVSVSDCYFLFR